MIAANWASWTSQKTAPAPNTKGSQRSLAGGAWAGRFGGVGSKG